MVKRRKSPLVFEQAVKTWSSDDGDVDNQLCFCCGKDCVSRSQCSSRFTQAQGWIDGGCEEEPVVIAWCDPCHEKQKLGDDVGMVITFRDGVKFEVDDGVWRAND